MTRGKEITPQLRSRICELHSIGWGARKISRVHPELSLSGIKYTIRKEKDRVNCVTRPRPGRPKKLSEDQRALIRAMVEADPAVKSAELLEAVGNAITKRSPSGRCSGCCRRRVWVCGFDALEGALLD